MKSIPGRISASAPCGVTPVRLVTPVNRVYYCQFKTILLNKHPQLINTPINKQILLTGATDGIGRLTAKKLVEAGHRVLIHGRSEERLASTAAMLETLPGNGTVESWCADLSSMQAVNQLAFDILDKHNNLDVLINNAGVLKSPETITGEGLDIRFAVNTVAPYLLARQLLPALNESARAVNVSSAAQAPFSTNEIGSSNNLADMDAYAKSKLAIIMWGNSLANKHPNGPAYIAVNPGSLLASKMVKEGFGIDGKSLDIGADILCKAALDNSFASASGKYFDNDTGVFANPLADAMDIAKCDQVVQVLESIVN